MTELSVADRKQLARDAVFGTKPKTTILEIFGTTVEVRQIPMRSVLEYQSNEDRARASAEMLIRYTYLPGTNIQLFDESDVESILALPFGDDMNRWQEAINKLTGVSDLVEEQLKNLTTTQP